MPPQDRIRLKRNPSNVATPSGSDDLYVNASGELIHQSPGGVKEIVGVGTTESILAALANANLEVDALTLGDTSADTLPDGAVGGTGTDGEFAWHNNSDEGGKVYKAFRNLKPNSYAVVANASIIAGVTHAELCRFRLEPSECVVGAKFCLFGTVLIKSTGTQSPAMAGTITFGVHPDGIISTTTTRGAYVTPTPDGAGTYISRMLLSLAFNLTQTTTDPLCVSIQRDTTIFAIAADVDKITLSTGAIVNSSLTSASGASNANNKLDVVNGMDVVVSLRLPQDASYLGAFEVIAQNLELRAIA